MFPNIFSLSLSKVVSSSSFTRLNGLLTDRGIEVVKTPYDKVSILDGLHGAQLCHCHARNIDMKQSTNNVLLIRPANFGFNQKTAASNRFQKKKDFDQQIVLAEFDAFAERLRERGVNVFVFNDTPDPPKCDAVFPNNWISFHPDGTVVLYPMSDGRQDERRRDIVEKLKENFKIEKILDLSEYEEKGKFLEGTGSIVSDHENRINYACVSPRTDKELFENISKSFGYKPVSFYAVDQEGQDIYHTNVMMCIGHEFSVICLGSIKNEAGRKVVAESLRNSGKEIVNISFEQMNSFAGNMLPVSTNQNQTLLVLSENAFRSLSSEQKNRLGKYCELFPLPIPTIEAIGGGSARCMIAEIFLSEI